MRTFTLSTSDKWLYQFGQLNADAQKRAIEDAIDKEVSDPCGHYTFYRDDIFEAVREFESLTPISIDCGRCDWDTYALVGDACPDAYTIKDNGDIYSMDICSFWNSRINDMHVITRAIEYADSIYDADAPERYQNIIDQAQCAYDSILQSIGDDVARYVSHQLNDAFDYCTSEEFWREYLDDGDTLFTEDGTIA